MFRTLSLFLRITLSVGIVASGPVAYGAEEHVCSLRASGREQAPTSAWQRAIDRLAAELSAAPSAACARVELSVTWEQAGARVHARTPDGLETSRLVGAPDALGAVAFGLIAAAPTEAPPVAPDPRDAPPPEPSLIVRPMPRRTDMPPRLSVSLASGVRGGFPTKVLMVDFELRADVNVHNWLVTLAMRAAPIGISDRLKDDPDGYEEASIGLGFGRELSFGRSALDLTVGPSLVYIWMENDDANLESEHAQLRLEALARWDFALSPRWRLNAVLDGEIAPTELAHSAFEAGLAPFPEATVGFRLGSELSL